EYMPDASHRQAVQHVLGWKLDLGKAMLRGKDGVLKWFERATAELQREHDGKARDPDGATGSEEAPHDTMSITGLNPVLDKNGEVVAFATRLVTPVSRTGLPFRDYQSEYVVRAAIDEDAPPTSHPLTLRQNDSDFVQVHAVRPRLDGTLEQLPRKLVRTLSIVWTPERIAFLASCAQALVSESPGHLLTGVPGCGKSIILASLASISAVGLGADVLYMSDGGRFVHDEVDTLLRGLSTCAGDALSGHELQAHMLPLLGSSEPSPQAVMDALQGLFGVPGKGPLRSPRVVVVDEANGLFEYAREGKQSFLQKALDSWCDWKGQHEAIGTMRVMACSTDSSLEVTTNSQSWDVLYDLGPTTIETMVAVLRSRADAELLLPGTEMDCATPSPTDRELQEALVYFGCIPRAILRYSHDLERMGHSGALFNEYTKQLSMLKRRMKQLNLKTGVLKNDLTWPTFTAATWGAQVEGPLSGLVHASMVSRINVTRAAVAGNALFASLAARHALLESITFRDVLGTDRRKMSNLLGSFPSNQETLERKVISLMALGVCGHRALGVGQKFALEEVCQHVEYPKNQSTSELMDVMSPSSLLDFSHLQSRLNLSKAKKGQKDVQVDLGAPPTLLRLDNSEVPADVLASLRNIGPGKSWVIHTWDNSPGMDALMVYCDRTGGKHAVLVEVAYSDLYAHAKEKGAPKGVPPALRGIAQVVLSEESRHELLSDGSVMLSHAEGQRETPTCGAASAQGSKGPMSVVNSWLQLLEADVRIKAELVSESDAGGAAGMAGCEHGSGEYKKLRVTAEPLEGVSMPEWRVHMLYITNTDLVANNRYLEQCAKYLDSPLVHAMVGDDFMPAPAPDGR
ncbi:unnamed protein product, partial [Symbiodinium sp. KB8]